MSESTVKSGLPDWPRAWGTSLLQAEWRARPDDFVVDESLSFTPSGEGEHMLLRLRKRGLDTERVIKHLSQCSGVARRDIGYAGLKDRNAVTSQWFSLPALALPEGLEFDTGMQSLQLLEQSRNGRKLRRGALIGNRFTLRLTQVHAYDAAALQERLAKLAEHGMPNYFGPQRFGRDGDNVAAATAWLRGERRCRGKPLQGIYLSALRSFLFNEVLAARITAGNWNQLLPGDILMHDGGHSLFTADPDDSELAGRVASGNLHPTGPLPGEQPPQAAIMQTESAWLQPHAALLELLGQRRLKHARRALRVMPADLLLETEAGGNLLLRFSLPAGAYATSLLRELLPLSPVRSQQVD